MVELQEHIEMLDIEGYNIVTLEYRKSYFNNMMDEISKYKSEILLYKEEVLGFIAGIINNEEESSYDFQVLKRGRITIIVVNKNNRSKGLVQN